MISSSCLKSFTILCAPVKLLQIDIKFLFNLPQIIKIIHSNQWIFCECVHCSPPSQHPQNLLKACQPGFEVFDDLSGE